MIFLKKIPIRRGKKRGKKGVFFASHEKKRGFSEKKNASFKKLKIK